MNRDDGERDGWARVEIWIACMLCVYVRYIYGDLFTHEFVDLVDWVLAC